jgi:hypothetical protein
MRAGECRHGETESWAPRGHILAKVMLRVEVVYGQTRAETGRG